MDELAVGNEFSMERCRKSHRAAVLAAHEDDRACPRPGCVRGEFHGVAPLAQPDRPAADGPRYKALGNSMAVNVMRSIGARIALVDAMEAA